MNGHRYFNVASIGFSAELAGEMKAEAKKRWGKLGYAIAAFGLLRRARPFTATLIHDGQVKRIRTIQVSVGNGKHYGGGMTVAEEARPDDGVFDVYSLEIAHWWRLVALLPWLRSGTQGRWKDVRAFRTTAHGAAHPQAAAGEHRWRAGDPYPGGVPAAAGGAAGLRPAARGLTGGGRIRHSAGAPAPA